MSARAIRPDVGTVTVSVRRWEDDRYRWKAHGLVGGHLLRLGRGTADTAEQAWAAAADVLRGGSA